MTDDEHISYREDAQYQMRQAMDHLKRAAKCLRIVNSTASASEIHELTMQLKAAMEFNIGVVESMNG